MRINRPGSSGRCGGVFRLPGESRGAERDFLLDKNDRTCGLMAAKPGGTIYLFHIIEESTFDEAVRIVFG